MKKTVILSAILISSLTFKAQSNLVFWQPINETKISVTGKRDIVPNTYKTFHLDMTNLRALLATAPSDKMVLVKNSSVIVELPMPNGKIEHFSVQPAERRPGGHPCHRLDSKSRQCAA